MGALSRPDIPPGPQRELVDALHLLHHQAGWPSLRVLAREAGCSPTTVSAVFSAPRLPAWGVLELIVEAMEGDVPDFRALWLAATTPETQLTAPVIRMAGRRPELAAVRRHLLGGAGRLLLVTGEAGMGKTRLVSAAATLAGSDTSVASGSCLPLSTDVPLLPVADVLRSVYEIDGGQWLRDALAGCAPYVAGTLRRLLPELEPLVNGHAEPDDEWSRHRLYGAFAGALDALAALRPLAVQLEDLHWADSATLDLVEHLVSRRLTIPVVATWRLDDLSTPTATDEWHARVRRLPTVDTLALGPLSRDETAEQLDLLAFHASDPDLVDRVHRRSEGQPLFTEQLAAQLDDDQPPPQLLSDLLDRRLEGLGERAWAIARALGVADRSLTDQLLSEVTDSESADLSQGLHELEARRLLRQSTGREIQLRHPLLAEAIRRRLIAHEVVDEHRRIAAALGRSSEPSAAEVAEHWQRGEEPAQEIIWRIRAARAAEQRFGLTQAAENWLRALAIWPADVESCGSPGTRRCDAYIAAIDALWGIDMEAASALGREALRVMTNLTDADAAALYRRAGDTQGIVGNPEEAWDLLQKAVRIYASMPESAAYVDALDRREAFLKGRGRYAEAAATVALATKVSARLGDARRHRLMLARQAWHDALAGDLTLARERIDTASVIKVSGPDPEGEIKLAMLHTEASSCSWGTPAPTRWRRSACAA